MLIWEKNSLLVIIYNSITEEEEKGQLLRVLQVHMTPTRWTAFDIKGISLSLCMFKILMEDDYKP